MSFTLKIRAKLNQHKLKKRLMQLNQDKSNMSNLSSYIKPLQQASILLIKNQLQAQAALQETSTLIKFPTDLMYQNILLIYQDPLAARPSSSEYKPDIARAALAFQLYYYDILQGICDYFTKEDIIIKPRRLSTVLNLNQNTSEARHTFAGEYSAQDGTTISDIKSAPAGDHSNSGYKSAPEDINSEIKSAQNKRSGSGLISDIKSDAKSEKKHLHGAGNKSEKENKLTNAEINSEKEGTASDSDLISAQEQLHSAEFKSAKKRQTGTGVNSVQQYALLFDWS